MVTPTAQIANMALGHIGISIIIENIDTDNSLEARMCKLYYAHSRDRILEQVDWFFARRRRSLALSTVTVPDGWEYAYDYPADCLATRFIVHPTIRTPAEGQGVPFAVYENEPDGMKIIATDQADAVLQFTTSISNPAMFTKLFTECLTWDLAAHVAGPLRADARLMQQAASNAQMWLNEAGAMALGQAFEDQMPDSAMVTGRF